MDYNITSKCADCGAESTLWFGFARGCRFNGGAHRNIVEIASTREHEQKKLRCTYDCCMSFDRANFNARASAEIKALLR